MAGGEAVIANVSDTARWVAAYRALETARPDALFRDPLADRLAGAHGHTIIETAPRFMRSGWPVVTRTKLMDDLIAASIADGCDRVLNLAAGLDTRPYRLELPAEFVWVEADLPDLLAEKERVLAGETPRCTLIRRAVDLADTSARAAFLDQALGPLGAAGAPAKRALVLTEGLLFYLDADTVAALAGALTRPEIAWWIADLVRHIDSKRSDSMFANAPMKFEPAEGVGFLEQRGWPVVEVANLFVQACKLRRAPWYLRPLRVLPAPDPRDPGRRPWSVVVRMRNGQR
ncbi:SAM-dependent methyltransferase [Nocardia vulneris]|uniref:class I SAM-dependent methyltransferase n=1 Tax=Nocardia vulneris TaxID=1141657 RepID=UPI0030D23B04